MEIGHIATKDDFASFADTVLSLSKYPGTPDAAALAVATRHIASGKILDLEFATAGINLDEVASKNARSMALFWAAAGRLDDPSGIVIEDDMLDALVHAFDAYRGDGDPHPNIDALDELVEYRDTLVPLPGHEYVMVLAWAQDLNSKPADVADAWLRLTMMSRRMVKPRTVCFDGTFGLLENVKWTTLGPAYGMTARQLRAVGATVLSQDRFPQLLWYVDLDDVRIASAASVRLGAYLGSGTVVMPSGFVNFNAGTLGKAMVEGRISGGVVVGNGSDIGGGSSTMGTMSGGNQVVVSVGEDCLLEANSGLGIPVGDRVRVSAGFYLKSTNLVALKLRDWPDSEVVNAITKSMIMRTLEDGWIVVKAIHLSGISDAIFRRHDIAGRIEMIARGNHIWGTLRADLHDNA